ncbi:MAG TPA: tetratricopeptide repeat protein, partial [Rhodanobacteraceae bacterium]|nr:tetratricopeptide repeat protein [Rhodanobacteraceae bacterium]
MHFATRYAIILIPVALALAGCSSPSPPAPQSVRIDRNALAAIRAAGQGLDSAVQVHPLRDPAVEGLLARAHASEAAHDYDAAV